MRRGGLRRRRERFGELQEWPRASLRRYRTETSWKSARREVWIDASWTSGLGDAWSGARPPGLLDVWTSGRPGRPVRLGPQGWRPRPGALLAAIANLVPQIDTQRSWRASGRPLSLRTQARQNFVRPIAQKAPLARLIIPTPESGAAFRAGPSEDLGNPVPGHPWGLLPKRRAQVPNCGMVRETLLAKLTQAQRSGSGLAPNNWRRSGSTVSRAFKMLSMAMSNSARALRGSRLCNFRLVLAWTSGRQKS